IHAVKHFQCVGKAPLSAEYQAQVIAGGLVIGLLSYALAQDAFGVFETILQVQAIAEVAQQIVRRIAQLQSLIEATIGFIEIVFSRLDYAQAMKCGWMIGMLLRDLLV